MQTIHLQSIGKVEAKPAQDFKVNEFIIWNFGNQSKIVRVVKETKAFITFELTYPLSGNDWANTGTSERRLKKSRLVGIGSEKIVKKYHKNYKT